MGTLVVAVFESLISEPYERAFKKPLLTAVGTIASREGLILSLSSSNGIVGKGEATPLLGRSIETLASTMSVLSHAEERIVGLSVPSTKEEFEILIAELLPKFVGYPALQFGIETAIASIVSQQLGIPFAHLYSDSIAEYVPFNILMSEEDKEIPEISEGTVVKIKVTTGRNLPEIIKKLVQLGIGEKQIRLDCNCTFELDEIEDLLAGVDAKLVEYIEDPLSSPTPNALERIYRGFGIEIALDEVLEVAGAFENWLSFGGFHVAVLKPTIHGGISSVLKSAQEASEFGIGVVISSCFETEIGIEACQIAASALPKPVRACGLDTLKLFSTHI